MNPEEESAARWLEEFLPEFETLEQRLNEAWWNSSTQGSPENQELLASAEKAFRYYLAEPRHLKTLRSLEIDQILDPLLGRQLDVANRLLERNSMDEDLIARLVPLSVEIESEYSNFRAELRGEEVNDNKLKDILRATHDSNLAREAWEASKQIGGQVADRVLELVGLRNEVAKRLGHENYQVMSLTLGEIEPKWLFDLLEDLADVTDEPFREIHAELEASLSKKFSVRPEELRPWHFGDPFFQSAPKTGDLDLDRFYEKKNLEDLTIQYFDTVGLDIREMLAASDLYERDKKCQHAFCTHIDRRGDVRVLCNVRPDEEWMSTMLHEFGHAVYDKYLDADLPTLLREPAHTLTTEAVAMLFGRLSRNSAFLVNIADAECSEAESVAARAREELRRGEIVFIRWALVVIHFERELYANPDQDLDAMWWRLVEKYQFLTPPEDRNAPDWAAKIHIATVPIYYQNYVLGELTASQLQQHILDKIVDTPDLVRSRKIGEYLVKQFFEPGNRRPWRELIAESTGEELSPSHFIREFTRA